MDILILYYFFIAAKKKKLDIEVGDIVKAMFENAMYRAKILKKVDNNHFYISFIDFGNEETVNADDIYELPEELIKVLYFII